MKSDTSNRFAYIETRLQWGDGLTARELAETFRLTRQTAQGLIDEYRQRYPGNLHFDPSVKKQLPGESFSPRHISKDAGHFLDYLRGHELVGYYLDQSEWSELSLVDVDRFTRPKLNFSNTRELLASLRNRHSLRVTYRAKTRHLDRDICPHSIIFASNRYHVRAYCHLSGHFLDLVISRIDNFRASQEPWVPSSQDGEWNEYADIVFTVNHSLPRPSVVAIRMDYGLKESENLTVTCRKALAFYVRRELLAVDLKYGMPRWVEVTASS